MMALLVMMMYFPHHRFFRECSAPSGGSWVTRVVQSWPFFLII
jgi:hypothetical protein